MNKHEKLYKFTFSTGRHAYLRKATMKDQRNAAKQANALTHDKSDFSLKLGDYLIGMLLMKLENADGTKVKLQQPVDAHKVFELQEFMELQQIIEGDCDVIVNTKKKATFQMVPYSHLNTNK